MKFLILTALLSAMALAEHQMTFRTTRIIGDFTEGEIEDMNLPEI